jgi:uncharacterized membrane protein YraQ (UPF0718 family)
MNKLALKEALLKTLGNFKQIGPIILGVLFLLGLAIAAIPKSFYVSIFTGNKITDPLMGALFGSVSAGNPITSYIIGGELLNQGVSLVAVAAFILAWVSVGVVQLPAESMILGRKFAITRNIASFVTAIIVAILTVSTLSLFL